MAKKKATKKKAAPKKKAAKPVAKKKAKPVKKAAAKMKKTKPAAKKKTASKPKVKAVKKASPKVKSKAKPAAKAPATKKPKATKAVVKKLLKKRKQSEGLGLRYSDDELKEFKDLIDKKLAAARDELKYLKEALDNHNENQMGNKAWNMEEGTDTSEMETLMNQISRQHAYIRNLEMALMRIENKTYGICRVTGTLIPKERLRVVPHATLSLEAKMHRKSDEENPALETAAAPPTDIAEGFED